MVGEGVRVVEDEADEEHGETPADGGEHALAAVLVGVLLAEQVEDGRIGQRQRRTAEELADDDQQQEEEEDLAHVVQVEHGEGEGRRHPVGLRPALVVDGELERVRRLADLFQTPPQSQFPHRFHGQIETLATCYSKLDLFGQKKSIKSTTRQEPVQQTRPSSRFRSVEHKCWKRFRFFYHRRCTRTVKSKTSRCGPHECVRWCRLVAMATVTQKFTNGPLHTIDDSIGWRRCRTGQSWTSSYLVRRFHRRRRRRRLAADALAPGRFGRRPRRGRRGQRPVAVGQPLAVLVHRQHRLGQREQVAQLGRRRHRFRRRRDAPLDQSVRLRRLHEFTVEVGKFRSQVDVSRERECHLIRLRTRLGKTRFGLG